MSATHTPGDHLATQIPAITGIRGLAAMWVMLFHLYEFSHRADLSFGPLDFSPWLLSGYLGVDLFFVLSGFLLVQGFIHPAREPIRLRVFWRHRFRRVLPALWAQLAILLGILAATGSALPSLFEIGTLFSLSFNLWANDTALNPVYWSMPVEWNFYMVLPLLALGFRGTRKRMVSTLILLVASALAFRWLCIWSVTTYGEEGVVLARWIIQLPGRIDQFALGMAAAWCVLHCRPTARFVHWLVWLGCATALGLAAFAVHLGNYIIELQQPWSWLFTTLIGASFAVLVLGVATARDSLASKLLASRTLVWHGTISYSLYLWHFPILQGFTKVFARPVGAWDALWLVGLILLVSALSQRAFEQPFLRRDRAPQHRDA